jgi:hypothetical protein
MKKPLLFMILIASAGILMWAVDYASSAPPTEEMALGGLVKEPKVVREFKAFCDTLREDKWEPAAFQERVDRLNVYRQQDIISASEFMNLEEYMYSAYASSINNTYEAWKQNCDAANIGSLHAEIKRLCNVNSACKNKLQQTAKEITDYYVLIGIPAKVSRLISGEYNEASCKRLMSQVQAVPNHFSRCSNVSSIKSEANLALQNFQTFAVNYTDAMRIYERNPRDFYTQRDLTKLNEKARNASYHFYINQLRRINVRY